MCHVYLKKQKSAAFVTQKDEQNSTLGESWDMIFIYSQIIILALKSVI